MYPPIIRVRLSNDVIKIHFRLAAIDLDMKHRHILLFFSMFHTANEVRALSRLKSSRARFFKKMLVIDLVDLDMKNRDSLLI